MHEQTAHDEVVGIISDGIHDARGYCGVPGFRWDDAERVLESISSELLLAVVAEREGSQ